MSRYRLYVRLYSSHSPPTLWKGAFQYDGNGIQIDCESLPSDVSRAVLSGLSHDGHYGGGCMLDGGRYITYVGRAA